MRILILSNSTMWGGLEAHTVTLAGSLAAAGHDTSIVCFGPQAADVYRQHVPRGVTLVDVGPPDQRRVWQWLQTFRALPADAAILEKGTLWTGSVALDVALRLTYRRYVIIHQLEPPPLPPRSSRRYLGGLVPGIGLWWYRWKLAGYFRSLAPHTNVGVSDAVQRALNTDYAFHPRKQVTIHHGVDTGKFRPSDERRAAARQLWNVPQDALVFGSLRRFVRDKGLDVAIDAFAQAVSRFPDRDMRLVLIGEGPEEAALKAQAKDRGVGHLVVFPGFTPTPWEIYPGLDVFIIPSRIEALGVVVIEAMASECYVIGTRVGGIPEMMSEPPIGALVPPGDANALASAMSDVITMGDEARRSIAARGRTHTGANFDVNAQASRFIQLLQ